MKRHGFLSAFAWAAVLHGSTAAAVAPSPPDPAEIVRRAETMRNPAVPRAVEVEVRSVSPGGTIPERIASYTLLARGPEDTLLLRRSDELLRGTVILVIGGQFWRLFPNRVSTTPSEVAPENVLYADFVGLGIARLDLTTGWSAKLLSEEDWGGEPCYKLELDRKIPGGIYRRALYWVSKRGLRPKRLECFLADSRLANMTRYETFVDTPLGTEPGRVVVENGIASEDMHTLTFSSSRRLDTQALDFSQRGTLTLREAARRKGVMKQPTAGTPIEEILGK